MTDTNKMAQYVANWQDERNGRSATRRGHLARNRSSQNHLLLNNPGNKENWITAFAAMTRKAPAYSVNF